MTISTSGDPNGMKILTLDIETSPNKAFTWGMWKQDISLSQLIEVSEVLCFAAKWLHSPEVLFYSEWGHSREGMIAAAYDLLDEADAAVHYNGGSFDIPVLNGDFVLQNMGPPSFFHQIDLLKVVKKNFRFQSNKLQHVSTRLGLAGKESHSGFSLWVDVMNGDQLARDKMKSYNCQDVLLTEELYYRILPWITNHPNKNLYLPVEEHGCPRCSSKDLQKRGFATNASGRYQRWWCFDCGGWSQSTSRMGGVRIKNA